MEKTFTLNDLQHYFQEIRRVENMTPEKKQDIQGPGNLTIQNILKYSSAMKIMKTKTAGTIYQLVN